MHSEYKNKQKMNGKPVVNFDDVEHRYPPEEYDFFVAVGYSDTNKLREGICKSAKQKGYSLTSYVSSKAITWPGFKCGENCLILESNNIQPYVSIGNNVTLWSGNHIGHHSIIEDNAFISSHVVVSGGCHIKRNSFIGVNATLRDHICVEEYNIIAAGALLTKSTAAYGVYVGAPAKPLDKKSFELDGI